MAHQDQESYIPRLLDLEASLRRKSCFLFGPRQTGKSTLVRHTLPGARIYNLLDADVYSLLGRRPSILREEAEDGDRIVVIDEIQKLPSLLDEVHLMIEERGTRFLLTGSSARKLRRGGVNLLGGRARELRMHPLVYREMPKLDLLAALNQGLLPSIHFSDEPDKDLASYVGTYLREEVAAEAAARNIPAFGRFMEVAALCNATMINFAKISNDAQVARTTVQEYFKVLTDTMIAHFVPAWRRTVSRKPIGTSKFYLFDTGVARSLRNEGRIRERSPSFGPAFETYVFHELKSYADLRLDGTVSYWRSRSGFEVDFVLGYLTAIEVKGTDAIGERDLSGLRALREEGLLRHYVLVSLVERPRTIDGIRVLPWRTFLDELWEGGFE